jgi:hypothetical protein
MKYVPIWLVGAGAAAMGWSSGPLFQDWSDSDLYETNPLIPMGGLAIAVYAPFFLAVVGGTVLAFRALWLTTQRAELAARIAMGSTRGSLVASEVRTGLRDGIIAGGGGIAVGAILSQLRTGFTDVVVVWDTLWTYLAVVGLAVVSFAIAYWIAAAWVTRGSVREVASGATGATGSTADARAGGRSAGATRARRSPARVVLVIAIALAALSLFVLLVSPAFMSTDGTATGAMVVVQFVATTILFTGLYLALPGLLVYAAAKAAVWFARLVGAMLARSANPGSARSLAADGLARPMPMRTGSVAAVITVMGAAVTATALYYGIADSNNAASDLAPHASISTVDLVAGAPSPSVPSGWAEPLPRDLVEALHADPDLVVLDAGVLTTDARSTEFEDEFGEIAIDTTRQQLLAVEPAALDAISPHAAKRLYLTDATQWLNGSLGWGWSYGDNSQSIAVNGVSADTQEVNGISPWAGVSRPWAESVWDLAPTAAIVLYPAGTASVQDVLAGYDLAGLDVVHMGASFDWRSSAGAGVVAAVTIPFLLIAVAIVIALAWSGQRLRARDQATLLALGATPAALRGAAALESAVLTAVAGATGCVGGAIIGPVLAEIGSSAPIATAGPGLVLWNMGHTLTVMPWGMLVGLVLGAAAIAAGGAALIRVRLDRLTPAQQLTEAQKAGIS